MVGGGARQTNHSVLITERLDVLAHGNVKRLQSCVAWAF